MTLGLASVVTTTGAVGSGVGGTEPVEGVAGATSGVATGTQATTTRTIVTSAHREKDFFQFMYVLRGKGDLVQPGRVSSCDRFAHSNHIGDGKHGALREMSFKEQDDGLQHLRDGQVIRGEVQMTFTSSTFKPEQLLGARCVRPVGASLAEIHRRHLHVEVDQRIRGTAPRPQVVDARMFLHHQSRASESARNQAIHQRRLASRAWSDDDNVQLATCLPVQQTTNPVTAPALSSAARHRERPRSSRPGRLC